MDSVRQAIRFFFEEGGNEDRSTVGYCGCIPSRLRWSVVGTSLEDQSVDRCSVSCLWPKRVSENWCAKIL